MVEKYYVQRFARQILNQIKPVPEGLIIPEKHLQGLENNDFVNAVKLYQEIIESILRDVLNAPENFGLPCITIFDTNEAFEKDTSDKIKSGKAFSSLIPNIFLAIGQTGIFTSDRGLNVNITAFKKAKINFNPLYVNKPNILLHRLTDYGFEFEGLGDDYDLKNKHSFTVYYPDNPYLLHVLKSFGSLHTKAVAVDYRCLLLTEDNIKLNNFYEIEDIYKILLREEDKDFLYSIHSKLTNRGYRFNTVSPIAPYNGVSYKYDDGEEMLLFEISHSDVLSIKFTPRNIKAYSDKINLFSMKIRDILLNGQNCINCGRCKNPASFVYEGKIIKKCIENKVWRPRFTDLNKDDRESILMMLDCETTKM